MRHLHMNYFNILPVLVHGTRYLLALKSRANRTEGFASLIQLLLPLRPRRRRRKLTYHRKLLIFA
jgi:hypothetical protein